TNKTCTVTAPATSCTVTGLANGSAVTFTVTASNAKGAGVASAASDSVTPLSPYAAPSPPSFSSVLPGDASLVVTIAQPDNDGGKAISSTTVSILDASGLPVSSCQIMASAGACTAKNLVNGSPYTAVAFASNVIGNSPLALSTDAVIPFRVSDAPGMPTLRAGNQQVKVYWSPPADNGGKAVTSYEASLVDQTGVAAGTCSPTDLSITSCVVTGLDNGMNYSASITATTDAGTSPSSPLSSSVLTAGPPTEPLSLRVSAKAASVLVSWTPPEDSGGVALISTTVTLTGADGSSATCYAVLTATQCTVLGLTNGMSYIASAISRNPVGYSAPSADSDSVTPLDIPLAPASVTATSADASMVVSWTAPASDGGSPITGYRVRVLNAAGATLSQFCTSTDPAVLSCTVSGLTNGISYRAVLTASNALGDSLDSNPSAAVTPIAVPTKPAAPAAPSVLAGPASVLVTWLAPSSTGGPSISSYSLCITGVLPCTVLPVASIALDDQGRFSYSATGLINKTSYSFTVAATNAVGTSTPSPASASVKPKSNIVVPTSPTGVGLTALDTQTSSAGLHVSWSAPLSNGGSAITRYQVTLSDAFGATLEGANCATLTLNCDITGLPVNVFVVATVVAVNAAGVSAAGDPAGQASTTTAIAPDAPELGEGYAGIYGQSSAGLLSRVGGTLVLANPLEAGSHLHAWIATGPSASPIISVDGKDGSNFAFLAAISVSGLDPSGLHLYATVVNGAGLTSAATDFTYAADFADVGVLRPRVSAPGVPNAPTSVIASPGDGLVTVGWTASDTSDSSPSPLFYVVTAIPGGKTCVTTRLSCTVKNLTNGTDYTFTVKGGINTVGSLDSEPSSSVQPYSPFSSPTAPSITGSATGNGTIEVDFTAPEDDGGKPITGYQAIATPGGRSCTTDGSSSLSCVIRGLTNGASYAISIKAFNAIGAGQTVRSAALRPHAVAASAPAKPSVLGLDATLAVTWLAPSDNGGSTVSSYRVTAFNELGDSAGTCTAAAPLLTCRIAGLPNNASYTASVKAINGAGISEASTESSAAILRPSTIQAIRCMTTDANTCLAVGTNGTILKTSDAGASWSRQTSPVTSTLNAISCPTESSCVAVGASGKLLLTTNLNTWTVVRTPSKAALSSVACATSTSCGAVGAGGIALVATTSLTSWAVVSTGVTAALSAVNCVKSCIAVGKAGAIVVSKDKGMTWTPTLGIRADLRSVSCASAKKCIAVGKAGTVVSFKKGGTVATLLASTGSRDLIAVRCLASLSCVAVGAGGFRYLSTDMGVSFTADTIGVATDLYAVDATSSGSFITGGPLGLLSASSNGGATWIPAVYPN
ncbi:MAG: fibronectin type III domain-containing protein, partial [Actinobacteria bacterium]|nr:fibronectin type III domain-containing protein [Actinomycetota bacterium]